MLDTHSTTAANAFRHPPEPCHENVKVRGVHEQGVTDPLAHGPEHLNPPGEKPRPVTSLPENVMPAEGILWALQSLAAESPGRAADS